MSKLTTWEKIEKYLFTDNDDIKSKSKTRNEVVMSPTEMKILMRARAAFSFWLEKPELPDSKVVEFLMNNYEVEKTTAYNDMFAIKGLLGNVRNAKKEFSRYTVEQMCKRAFEIAETQKDPKAMVLAADKIGKYTRCDQNESEEIPWDKIIPANFEPVSDISVLNNGENAFTPITEERREKLRAKYKGLHLEDAHVMQNDDD